MNDNPNQLRHSFFIPPIFYIPLLVGICLIFAGVVSYTKKYIIPRNYETTTTTKIEKRVFEKGSTTYLYKYEVNGIEYFIETIAAPNGKESVTIKYSSIDPEKSVIFNEEGPVPSSLIVIFLGLMFTVPIIILGIENEILQSFLVGLGFTAIGIIIPLTTKGKSLITNLISLVFLIFGLIIVFSLIFSIFQKYNPKSKYYKLSLKEITSKQETKIKQIRNKLPINTIFKITDHLENIVNIIKIIIIITLGTFLCLLPLFKKIDSFFVIVMIELFGICFISLGGNAIHDKYNSYIQKKQEKDTIYEEE